LPAGVVAVGVAVVLVLLELLLSLPPQPVNATSDATMATAQAARASLFVSMWGTPVLVGGAQCISRLAFGAEVGRPALMAKRARQRPFTIPADGSAAA